MGKKLQHDRTFDKGGRVEDIAMGKKKHSFLGVNGLAISRAPQLDKTEKPFCGNMGRLQCLGLVLANQG